MIAEMVGGKGKVIQVIDNRRIRVTLKAERRSPRKSRNRGVVARAVPLFDKRRQGKVRLAAQDEVYEWKGGKRRDIDGGRLGATEQGGEARVETLETFRDTDRDRVAAADRTETVQAGGRGFDLWRHPAGESSETAMAPVQVLCVSLVQIKDAWRQPGALEHACQRENAQFGSAGGSTDGLTLSFRYIFVVGGDWGCDETDDVRQLSFLFRWFGLLG